MITEQQKQIEEEVWNETFSINSEFKSNDIEIVEFDQQNKMEKIYGKSEIEFIEKLSDINKYGLTPLFIPKIFEEIPKLKRFEIYCLELKGSGWIFYKTKQKSILEKFLKIKNNKTK